MRAGLLVVIGLVASSATASEPPASSAEDRAIGYLAREVPRWSRENRCFSCHNNGDAARALYAGIRAGFQIERGSLAETTAWLTAPARWDHNGGDRPYSDKRLARIQFTNALAAAHEAGLAPREALRDAASRLALDQAADGSWPLEGDDLGGPGSAAAYDRGLATFLARESLRSADPVRFRASIERSGRWLASREIQTVGDASVGLLLLSRDPELLSQGTRESCLATLRKGQSDDGGWGPFVASPPEVFDTALAVLALASFKLREEDRRMLELGRTFLIERQRPDGCWTETTRPPGAESYAQRISTTAWASLALFACRQALPGGGPNAKR
jgi:hypothetical protein